MVIDLHALTYAIDGTPGTLTESHEALIADMVDHVANFAPGWCLSAPQDERAPRQIISLTRLDRRISFTLSKALILQTGTYR
ncbi:hypothetical protein [Falsirhodobacter xinxiangensis]|uniref:hypothetical protein n=1 Tax=Falsirhodobacter xinxiangensis TaxID=2530049 RepID=UPI0010A9B3ED|nr:hypothetical protein [Rhodobacter xinxiangensis]